MSDSFEPDFAGIGRPAPDWPAKRPLRIGILGDFGGGACQGRLDTGAALAARKPRPVEFDTLEDAMRRFDLKLALPVGADGAPVEVEIADLDAFHPDQIFANVALFAELAALRRKLNDPAKFAAAAASVTAWAKNAGPRASSLARKARARGSAPARGATLDDFARLTGRPSTKARADGAVEDLLRRIVGPFVQPAPSPKKEPLVAAVDAGLGDAMRAVLHHPDFQTCESLWRGVDFVLRRIETGPRLQVHLIDVSAEEFAADLSSVADLADCGLYRLLVDAPAQDAEGGYTYLAACYQFDATPVHAELLGRAAKVAAHAGASLLTGIATDPFADRREPPHRLVREAFAALRELPEASFLGLFGPRFLLRHPYGKKSDPISSFAFEEFSREAGLRGMLWGHPALLALAVLANPGAPLTVDDLPFHHYVDDDGDVVALPCTDRLISANVASLLREAGINALMAHKGEALVRFNGIEAVNGDGLAAGGAAAKKAAPAGARFVVQSKIDTKAAAAAPSDVPAARRGGAPAAAPVAESADEAVEGEAEAPSDELAESAEEEGAPAAAAGGGDDELSSLLASLDEGDKGAESAEEPAAAEPAMDPDLAALLKSLG